MIDHVHLLCSWLGRVALLPAVAALGLSLFASDVGANTGKPAKRVAIVPQPTDGGALRVEVGQPVMLSARSQLDSGVLMPFEGRVTWNSSNPTVAQVTSLGDARSPALVTPLRPGIASVTITYPALGGIGAVGSTDGVIGDVVTLIVEDRS